MNQIVQAMMVEIRQKINKSDIAPYMRRVESLSAQRSASPNQRESSIQEIRAQLVSKEEFSRTILEHNQVIQTLLSKAALTAEWRWEGGPLAKKRNPDGSVSKCVPWSLSSVKQDSQEWLWEKNKTSIVCVNPGIYEVTFVYGGTGGQVGLKINGERVKQSLRDPGMQAAGVSGIFVLEEKMRVSVEVISDKKEER